MALQSPRLPPLPWPDGSHGRGGHSDACRSPPTSLLQRGFPHRASPPQGQHLRKPVAKPKR